MLSDKHGEHATAWLHMHLQVFIFQFLSLFIAFVNEFQIWTANKKYMHRWLSYKRICAYCIRTFWQIQFYINKIAQLHVDMYV